MNWVLFAQYWFSVMRECGDDVRELLHDGHPFGPLIMRLNPRPNPSLNADVPHAGLRPGMRPPVSLVR